MTGHAVIGRTKGSAVSLAGSRHVPGAPCLQTNHSLGHFQYLQQPGAHVKQIGDGNLSSSEKRPANRERRKCDGGGNALWTFKPPSSIISPLGTVVLFSSKDERECATTPDHTLRVQSCSPGREVKLPWKVVAYEKDSQLQHQQRMDWRTSSFTVFEGSPSE